MKLLGKVKSFFHQSKVEENQRPCEWHKPGCMQYKKAESMLMESSTASVAHFRDVLEATHRNTLYARTLYSNIYDLKNGLVYLYYLHNFKKEVVIDLDEELKKGRHYYDLPLLFGKKLKYGHRVYKHPSPAFSISYPKHYKVIAPVLDEVLLVKYPINSTPRFGVYVENKPQEIRLQDIGQRYFTNEIKKYSTNMRLLSSAQTLLKDGTPASEVLFDRVVNDHWPLKTMVVSSYRGDKLIFAAATSFAHPETFREFLYSLRFD